MAVMTAVTELSIHHVMTMISGTDMGKKLTSVSTPELLFSDQEVGSLVVVPKSPNVGAVPEIRNSFPTKRF